MNREKLTKEITNCTYKYKIFTKNNRHIIVCQLDCDMLDEWDCNIRKSFTGKSVCMPEDTYNEQYGKNLAALRAEIAAYRFYKRVLDGTYRIAYDRYITLAERFTKYLKIFDHEYDYERKLRKK